MTRRRAAIVGVGLADVAQGPTSPYDLVADASRRALSEAGIQPQQVDGLASTGLGMMPPVEVAEYLGLRPRWFDSTSIGGASWEAMVAHAADAIAAGHADVVLVTYGSTAKSDLRQGLRTANLDWGSRGALQWEVPYGHTLIGKYAMAARRHMHEYGTTIEQLAEVAVSARANAKDNPQAAYREPDHRRRRAVRPDDRRSLHQTALLHSLRRCGGGGASRRGSPPGHTWQAGLGAGQR